MAGTSKWLKGAAPDDRLESVARQAIDGRLDLVWQYLSLAAENWKESVEHVHQLRVWSRRAVAAMSTFEDLLPKRRARWMNKQLKRVRRAAGNARDLDVLAERLKSRADADPEGAYGKVYALAMSEREKAQEPILRIYHKLVRKDFCRRKAALVERVRLRKSADKAERPTYASAARAALQPLVDDFLSALRHPGGDYAALHALRVCGKKLRYAMEIFAAAFPPAFRGDLYPQITAIQEKLGEINDHATACEYLVKWRDQIADPETAEALSHLIAEEQKAMDQGRDEFFEWLTPERRERLEQGFNNLLNAESVPAPAH